MGAYGNYNCSIHKLYHFLASSNSEYFEYQDIFLFYMFSKTCLKLPLKRKTKIGFQDRLSLNAVQKYFRMLQGEHSATLLTFTKL